MSGVRCQGRNSKLETRNSTRGLRVSIFDIFPAPGTCIRPCSAADQRGSVRRSRSSVQIRSGPPAGVAQWQSASPVRTKPAFDSRRRLHRCGAREAAHPALTRTRKGSSPFAPTKILAVVKVADTSVTTKCRTDCSLREKICPVSSDGL
jgi:hypothetical protein